MTLSRLAVVVLLTLADGAASFGYHGLPAGGRRVVVDADEDFVAALQDDSIDRIVLSKDLRLDRKTWVDGEHYAFPLVIKRNVTIKSVLTSHAFASLDFRYFSGKLRLDPGVWLTIYRLRLRGITASSAPSFTFVASSAGGSVLFRDCVFHCLSCLPMGMVHDSMVRGGAAVAATAAAAAAAASDAPAAGAGAGTTPGAGSGPGHMQADAIGRDAAIIGGGDPAAVAAGTQVDLLRNFCFSTVESGRQCRPLALQLYRYAYVAQQTRRTGGAQAPAGDVSVAAGGVYGFTLLAENTTLVCDYPVTEECVRDKGPEFCVKREVARRLQQQEQRSRWAMVLGVAATLAALVAGGWCLAKWKATKQQQQLKPQAQRRSAVRLDASDTDEQVEAEAEALGALLRESLHLVQQQQQQLLQQPGAGGYQHPLLTSPSGRAPGGLAFIDVPNGRTSPSPNVSRQASRTSTRNWERERDGSLRGSNNAALALALALAPTSSGHGHGHGGSVAANAAAVAAAAAAVVAARSAPQQFLAATGSADGTTGAGGGTLASAPQSGQCATEAVSTLFIEQLGRLMGQYELISPSDREGGGVTGTGTGSSGVKPAALETQERIELLRRTIPSVNAGGDVYDNLEVTELLGSGTFGKVFKGFWNGTLVAVKLMVFPAALTGSGQLEKMAAMEAAISSSLSHPNIVQTYTWRVSPLVDATSVQAAPPSPSPAPAGTQPASGGDAEGEAGGDGDAAATATGDPTGDRGPRNSLSLQRSSLPGQHGAQREQAQHPQQARGGQLTASAQALEAGFELCLILELCDQGSLRECLSRGGFRCSHDHGSIDYGAVLDVAQDVARAMSYLHSKQIVHSDLKSRNVLLKSLSGKPGTQGRSCCVVGKVSDFGLASRMEHGETHLSGLYQGTTAFMAPELSLYGRVSKAADVYSFGILLWELYTCGEAFKNIPKALLPAKVVEGLRPDFPPETPPEYAQLASACWAHEPANRPTFDQAVRKLTCMRAALHGDRPPLHSQQLGTISAQVRRRDSQKRIGELLANSAGCQPQALPSRNSLAVASTSGGGGGGEGGGGEVGREVAFSMPASAPGNRQRPTAGLDADVDVTEGVEGEGDDDSQRRPKPLPLLTGALGGLVKSGLDRIMGGDRRGSSGAAAARRRKATNDGVRAASVAAGSAAGGEASGSVLGVGLDTEELIDRNLLVVGGEGAGDGGSTMWGMS